MLKTRTRVVRLKLTCPGGGRFAGSGAGHRSLGSGSAPSRSSGHAGVRTGRSGHRPPRPYSGPHAPGPPRSPPGDGRSARPPSGTRCFRFAFIRLAGTVQTPASRSISAHSAQRTSLHLAAVSTRNSKASLATSGAVAARTVRMAAATSPWGNARMCSVTSCWGPRTGRSGRRGCRSCTPWLRPIPGPHASAGAPAGRWRPSGARLA